MPGLELGHYEIIARIYTPQFEPKIVLLALYAGNDIRKWFYTENPRPGPAGCQVIAVLEQPTER